MRAPGLLAPCPTTPLISWQEANEPITAVEEAVFHIKAFLPDASESPAYTPVRCIPAGVVDAFWEYRLKPWDVAAGVLIVQEAGGRVTTMDGEPFSVFSRSLLASNGVIHEAILEHTAPKTEGLRKKGLDFSPWYVPSGYLTD